jgi:hypothetical protein
MTGITDSSKVVDRARIPPIPRKPGVRKAPLHGLPWQGDFESSDRLRTRVRYRP